MTIRGIPVSRENQETTIQPQTTNRKSDHRSSFEILLAVGWYLRFSLSYRDVEELLAERGLDADHVTVWRWVQRYAPEIQRRLRPRLRPTNDSWRVDETYIRVKGKWVYLYRAVDSPPVRRSSSFCRPNATQQRLSAF